MSALKKVSGRVFVDRTRKPYPKPFWLAIVLILAASAMLRAREQWYPRPVDVDDVLYATSGTTMAKLALGFDSVLADLYWVRAVQHYGRERRSAADQRRYTLLHPFIEVTTTLDPHFTTAYQFGALFLAEPLPNGPGRLDQGIALLEKGLRVDPTRWQYAQYLGFLHYWHAGDRAEAGRHFARAAEMPGAPNWLKPLAVSTYIDGGEREAAGVMLDAMAQSDERWIREWAMRKRAEIDAR